MCMTNQLKKLRDYLKTKKTSNQLCWRIFFYCKDRTIKPIFEWNNRVAHRRWKKKYDRNKHLTEEYKKQLQEVFKGVLLTRPIPCKIGAGVELHTLTCHHHVNMYILALKSLLRFTNDVSVVAHDDGSLSQEDMQLIEKHIPGINIIVRSEADSKLEPILKEYPQIRSYRKKIVDSLEILDHIILANTERIITMNSDILFLKRPCQLIDWLNIDPRSYLYVYESSPAYQKEFLEEIGCSFPPHLTLAAACVYTDIMDLDLIERLVTSSTVLNEHLWVADQNMYPALMDQRKDKYSSVVFDQERYDASGIIRPGAEFRHYWSSSGTLLQFHIKDSMKVISELQDEIL